MSASQDYCLSDIEENGVATLTLNRPDKHNAFNDEMIAQMQHTLVELKNNPDVKLLVLKANGENFCAGADLAWMQKMVDYSEEENVNDALALAKMIDTIYHFGKPTIAIVQGKTFGGGVGLLCACDLVVAANNATFCFSEVKIGLIPAVISPFVVKSLGERQTRALFISGEVFDAKKAQQYNLCYDIVAPYEVDERAKQLIEQLLKNSPQAMQSIPHLVNVVQSSPLNETLLMQTAKMIASIRISSEGQEGLKAFLEKRKPSWVSNDV